VLLIVKFIPECNSSDSSTVYWSTAPAFSMTVTVVIVAVAPSDLSGPRLAPAPKEPMSWPLSMCQRALDSQETAPFPTGRRRLRSLGNSPIRRRRKRRYP